MNGATPVIARPMASAKLRLSIGEGTAEVPIQVPSDPVAAEEVLPAVRRIHDALVEGAKRLAARDGKAVSCQRGCAACCRQVAAVADVEARALANLVAALPEPRRGIVEARFVDALARMEAADLARPLMEAGESGDAGPASHRLGVAYHRLAIACPFLEDEACSIYADRPLSCRQYMVVSPPVHCQTLESPEVHALTVHGMAGALQELTAAEPGARRRWIALPAILDWARANPVTSERKPGPAWIAKLLAAAAKTGPTPPAG